MKQRNIIIRSVWVCSASLLIALVPISYASAQGGGSASPVAVESLSDSVTKTINGFFATVYNKLLQAWADVIYEVDSQLPGIIVASQNQINGGTIVNAAIQKASVDEINSSFASIKDHEQQQAVMSSVPAGDDYISDLNSKDLLRSIFSSPASLAVLQQQNEEALKGNAMFDFESLVGTDSYNSPDLQQNAQAFLNQINIMAPKPPVIRIAPVFSVPITNAKNPSQKSVLIGIPIPLNADQIQNLRTELQRKPEYREYRQQYRAAVTTRNILLNAVLHSYQERLPVIDGKSAMQIRDDAVNSRFSAAYYNQISTASPATVQRETLFLLAQISKQLNQIQKQNERMILVNSISGLASLSVSQLTLKFHVNNIGKLVLCTQDPKNSLCEESSGDSSTDNSSSSNSDTSANDARAKAAAARAAAARAAAARAADAAKAAVAKAGAGS